MKEKNDIDFVSLLQDETFIKLVKDTLDDENQKNILENQFPGQHENIVYSVEFIKANLSEQKSMAMKDVNKIWQKINEYSGQSRKSTLRKFIFGSFLKVAAILFFVFISSVFIYKHYSKESLKEIAGSMKVENSGEAMIIMSDGSTHKLSSNGSQIEYSENGSEILVKKDQKEEKLQNKKSSKETNINQIVVPFGRTHSITLSDGTRVQLNAGSRLVFPVEFLDKTREVYLKGEGYFEVSQNLDKPFIVKTDFFDTEVLGTVFNITAYEDGQIASAVLVEGSVMVSRDSKLHSFKDKKLSPGQACLYSPSTGNSEIRYVDIDEYISWKNGVLLFTDKFLFNIVGQIEKFYNQKVIIEGERLSNTLISGKLVLPDNIEEVMQYLAKTTEARYEKNEDGILTLKEVKN